MTKWAPSWLREIPGACAGALMYWALFGTANTFFYLPAGIRFATLLLLPCRSWPWFFIAQEILFAHHLHDVSIDEHVASYETYGIVLMIVASIAPWWLRLKRWWLHPMTLAGMAKLVALMLLSAMGTATTNLLFYRFNEAAHTSPLRLALQLLLGDYIGLLAVVPLALTLFRAKPDADTWRWWRFDIPAVLAPILTLYFVLDAHATESQVFFFAVLLSFMPTIYFAVRSGWRGAALALSATSCVVAFSGFVAGHADLTLQAQGFLAIAGSATLILGAARDVLAANQRELSDSHARLIAASIRQDRLAGELHEAARRNLDTAEHTRRWITSELHDEIGQNLAALQVRVRLLERRAGAEGSELARDIAVAMARMRQTVSGLLSSLRPVGLDDFGLASALTDGEIRSMVEAGGLAFNANIDDPKQLLGTLDDYVQTALYRITQELATNTIRHAFGAKRLSIRIRARPAEAGIRVLLAFADDGHGFDTKRPVDGIGIAGIKDRALTLGGRLRLRSDARGTRLQLRASFRPALASGAS